ncbi:prisilkin-39-like isoform X2 [Monomorium pharaonis]|uniref:prisilkin-39-like isoform X2 n=1 Tax=Monomorium pharaonis TaxID=307658 RepID=UPI00174712A7|nr:prisilkin-39-like isoform X2 [Monomorium pharaonis]
MFSRSVFNFFFGALLIIAVIPDGASYNKYGRTCKDIGCRSDEMCVMAEDPCTAYTDKCGRYPTCRKISDSSCTSMVCGENEYCKSENGAPKCVRKSTGLENDEMRTRIVPKRQTNYPTAAETHGSSDTSKYSDGQSYPTRASGYQSGLGYPDNNGYPRSGSSKASDDSTNQPRSGYSSNDSASYPSRRSSDSFSRFSGYPTRESAGYPTSGSSNYPPGGSLGYSTSRLPGYLSNGYSSSQSSDYPSSGSSGSLSEFSYHNSKDSSDYPTGSGYPNRNGGSSNNSRNPYGEETVRRTGVNAVNTGYPSYPQGNPSYRGNYPARNTGYLDNNQHPLYSNQGYSNGYPQNYPQGGYSEGYYRSQNYMTTTKRPGFREQLTNFARNVAEKVLTQTILDRVTGKHQ